MIDELYQLAYKTAYRMMRVYWAVRQPDTHGALVAIWHHDRILLVKNSYVPYYSLPGGYVQRGETSRQAALRELREEVGVVVGEEALTLAVDVTHQWENKKDHVEIFCVELNYEPNVSVDNREVIAAGFFDAAEAERMDLFPPIRRHIRERRAQKPS